MTMQIVWTIMAIIVVVLLIGVAATTTWNSFNVFLPGFDVESPRLRHCWSP